MPAVTRKYKPGEFIFTEGMPSEFMYLIKNGCVAIRKKKGSGYIEIARLYSNEVLGELSFFDRQPRSASALALTEVEILELNFKDLDKVYKRVPGYFKSIMVAVADRLRRANDTIRRLQKETLVTEGDLAHDGVGGAAANEAGKIVEAAGSEMIAELTKLGAGADIGQDDVCDVGDDGSVAGLSKNPKKK